MLTCILGAGVAGGAGAGPVARVGVPRTGLTGCGSGDSAEGCATQPLTGELITSRPVREDRVNNVEGMLLLYLGPAVRFETELPGWTQEVSS
ncbi:hypothetical protein EYF80_052795 [Liparis tanakae]|uniref:Uncharacterized protein n=1 Tax=Liparis tanakae TaxID=230148 RepID=A0A4Z2F709_9TELE|nr:hypothetical protein EYF80_052795 [Liparis tanakae]